MRIAFDQQIFGLQEYGGISRYFCSLAEHLSKIGDTDVRIFAPVHINGHLARMSGRLAVGVRRPRFRPRIERAFGLASDFLARPAMSLFHPDIVHETYYSSSAFAPRGAKRVLTVYDMIHERFAQSFSPRDPTTQWKKDAVARAEHVICISENTRRDLVDSFGVAEAKVSVVYLGYDVFAEDRVQTEAVAVLSRPYLLHVGTRGGYKNFEGLLRAYASSGFLNGNFSLVAFGDGPFRPGEETLIRELGLSSGQVRQIGGEDDVLHDLYRGAAAFVYPSMYEGFGIPPLEAMSMGCPVICSNTSSVPEVVGSAGEYFDPGNIESIRTAMEAVLQSSTRRDELVRQGHIRQTLFSWARCADETMAIYRSLI